MRKSSILKGSNDGFDAAKRPQKTTFKLHFSLSQTLSHELHGHLANFMLIDNLLGVTCPFSAFLYAGSNVTAVLDSLQA